MATRSTIAMEQPCGKIMQIYCHYDGYLEHNGRVLVKEYNNDARVFALMMLGNISYLENDISKIEVYSESARIFQNYDDYVRNHGYEEFEYIFRNGTWYVCDTFKGSKYCLLERELLELDALDD